MKKWKSINYNKLEILLRFNALGISIQCKNSLQKFTTQGVINQVLIMDILDPEFVLFLQCAQKTGLRYLLIRGCAVNYL